MTRVVPRLISLDVTGTDRSDEVSKAIMTSGPSSADFMSLAEARNGGKRDYALSMTIAQDMASTTLWMLCWTGAGTLVEAVIAPYGNEVPTVAQPHFKGTVRVSEPDGDFVGAEANPSVSEVATVDVVWPFTAKPELVTVAP